MLMPVETIPNRPIWLGKDGKTVCIIDQRLLPHRFETVALKQPDDAVRAIREMMVRGAPLISVTAAYGVYLAILNHENADGEKWKKAVERIRAARPTAVNLMWAVDRMLEAIEGVSGPGNRIRKARDEASDITEAEAENCRRIGLNGLPLIEEIVSRKSGEPVNILTHCNAGWLACVEYGTATAPIYAAHERDIPVHVWVDETRPLNQGARLTAWELSRSGVPHTVITDNAGGHLMQHGMVDMVIVGTDRTTKTGDVANKIGTYLKALAARDNNIPFYVALPSSTFDWEADDGVREIPIEIRDEEEVLYVLGLDGDQTRRVLVPPAGTPAMNVAFDVTPSRLVSGFITERGVCGPGEGDILGLFPEKKNDGD